MSDHNNLAEFKSHLKVYIGVFVALLVMTIITVLISRVDLGSKHTNIVVALVIATFKASLVAGWFMHLASEKRSIYRVLYFTFFFVTVLVALTLWTMNDHIHIH